MSQDILKKSLGGGVAGAGAVFSSHFFDVAKNNLTIRHGGTETLKLYKEGGILRFYKGYIPAICIGP